jgi:dolichyl-phosphate-mannose--protein O-mannosyl transferase
MYPGGRDGNNSRLLPIILLAVSAVAIVATIVLLSYGIYFFFFFLPITFSLPWSIKRLRSSGAKKQWNVEDLR